jgi:3-phytase/alkaline phosphatase D
VRFATYNTSLNRNNAGELLAELRSGQSAQAANVSAILQSIRPHVLVLNEFDYEPDNEAVKAFQDNFLGVSQGPGLEPLRWGGACEALASCTIVRLLAACLY